MLIPKLQKKVELIKIDAPWTIEYIEEKFDDALLMLTDKCIIYGGSIRDILAGLPIGGDLDVAIPHNQYSEVQQKFSKSVRWINEIKQVNSAYTTSLSNIISSISSYTNIDGDVVQLIQAKETINKCSMYDSSILDILLNVDLVCSGIIMDMTGNVYEVVNGAHDDCIKKVLNFNTNLNKKNIVLKNITNRLLKLTRRGWSSNVDLGQFTNDSIKIKSYQTKQNHLDFVK